MNQPEIDKLLKELEELAALHDPAFTAPTQSRRVCGEAAKTIHALRASAATGGQAAGGR
jgi:hypothetical protein